MSKVDVVEILKKSDALLEGHFLLSSGKHSNRYVQCAKVLRFPQYAEAVLSTVVEQIKDFHYKYLTNEQSLLIDKLILNEEFKKKL
jgi:orotate phosphoribosyltransferase